jgi:hypothetical protein
MSGLLLVFVILGVVFGLFWLGYKGAERDLGEERDVLENERGLLDAEWTALEQSRRVNDVFFAARLAMRQVQDEADSDPHRSPRSGGQS